MLQEHPTWRANRVAESLPEKVRCATGPEDKWESRMQEGHLGKGMGAGKKQRGHWLEGVQEKELQVVARELWV